MRECRKYPGAYFNHDVKFFVLLNQRHPHRTRYPGNGRWLDYRGALRTTHARCAEPLHQLWWLERPWFVSSRLWWEPHPPGEMFCWSQSVCGKPPASFLQRGDHRRGDCAQRRWATNMTISWQFRLFPALRLHKSPFWNRQIKSNDWRKTYLIKKKNFALEPINSSHLNWLFLT